MNFQYIVKTGLKITVYLRPIVGGPTAGCGTVMQSTGQGIRGGSGGRGDAWYSSPPTAERNHRVLDRRRSPPVADRIAEVG